MKISTNDIVEAQRALIKNMIVCDNTYKHVFKGYISSFGASVAQAGLLPTIIFFEADSEKADERKKVIEALKMLLNIEGSLAQHLIENRKTNDQDFLHEVTHKMVAMKMALRLYHDK